MGCGSGPTRWRPIVEEQRLVHLPRHDVREQKICAMQHLVHRKHRFSPQRCVVVLKPRRS